MGYKCAACQANDVDNDGDICELCAIGQDPYASALRPGHNAPPPPESQAPPQADGSGSGSRGTGRSRTILLHGGGAAADPYGNDIPPADPEHGVQVYQAGQVPAVNSQAAPGTSHAAVRARSGGPITSGIIKNVTSDVVPKSLLLKWMRSLFTGVPFTVDNDVTSFQVFPDYSGTSVNSAGNACDQVIIYGKITAGTVSENNQVEVFGKRDANHNVVAKSIKNVASGTMVTAIKGIPAAVVRLISLLVLALVGGSFYSVGLNAALLAGMALILGLVALGFVFLKLSARYTKWFLICIISAIGVALWIFLPHLLSEIVASVVTIGVIYMAFKMLIKR